MNEQWVSIKQDRGFEYNRLSEATEIYAKFDEDEVYLWIYFGHKSNLTRALDRRRTVTGFLGGLFGIEWPKWRAARCWYGTGIRRLMDTHGISRADAKEIRRFVCKDLKLRYAAWLNGPRPGSKQTTRLVVATQEEEGA